MLLDTGPLVAFISPRDSFYEWTVAQWSTTAPPLTPLKPVRRDAIFYQIFQRFPDLFFELIGQPPERVQGYRFESVEIKEPNFRIDGVFLPPEEALTKTIFFAEVQFQKDQSLYHRFFAELFLYLYRNPTRYDDWYGVLIFPNRGLEPDQAAIHRALLHSAQVQCLYLDELGEPDQQPLGISLMQLMIQPESETAAHARQLIDRATMEETGNLSRKEIIDIVVTIATYKFINLSRQEVEAMLGLDLKQSRVYQDAKAEGREEGRVEGRVEGRQEGRQEGRLLTKLEMVPLLLEVGLTVEQIAARLELAPEVVRQATTQPNQES